MRGGYVRGGYSIQPWDYVPLQRRGVWSRACPSPIWVSRATALRAWEGGREGGREGGKEGGTAAVFSTILEVPHHFTRTACPGQSQQQGHHPTKTNFLPLNQPATVQFGIEPDRSASGMDPGLTQTEHATNLPFNCRHTALPPSFWVAPLAMVEYTRQRNSWKLFASLAGGRSSDMVAVESSVAWNRDSRYCSHWLGEDLQDKK